jgi:hypothetical protein
MGIALGWIACSGPRLYGEWGGLLAMLVCFDERHRPRA